MLPPEILNHQDASTLRNIAEQRPTSIDALGRVGGIGGSKLARYGQRVLDALGAAG